jgi:hypothetical protein
MVYPAFLKAPQTISCAQSNPISMYLIETSESNVFTEKRLASENGGIHTCVSRRSPSRSQLQTLVVLHQNGFSLALLFLERICRVPGLGLQLSRTIDGDLRKM